TRLVSTGWSVALGLIVAGLAMVILQSALASTVGWPAPTPDSAPRGLGWADGGTRRRRLLCPVWGGRGASTAHGAWLRIWVLHCCSARSSPRPPNGRRRPCGRHRAASVDCADCCGARPADSWHV